MLIASGGLLVLLTWGVVAACMVLVGMPLAALTHSGKISLSDVRRGLWWGLAIFTIAVMMLANVMPLGSLQAAWSLAVLILLGGIAAYVLLRRRGWRAPARLSSGSVPVIVLASLVTTYLALAALGPVTNFDSGLYHLSAVAMARDFVAIPGLANLHAPLGYANASFPLAAALGVTPWGSESYRLLNGLIITVVFLDLVLRWLDRRMSAGSFGLLTGAVVLAVPMVALSDYWATSPSQDAAIFAVVVAVSAMVMQSIGNSHRRFPEVAAAVAGSITLVLLRPTMAAFFLAVLVVGVVLVVRSRSSSHQWLKPLVLVGVLSILAGAAQIMRDYVLSGWLLYPLSFVPFDVPWRAPDPLYLRTATLGYHRDPSDLWRAADGWEWVGPWFGKLPLQWEFWLLLLLILVLIVGFTLAFRFKVTLRFRAMLMAMFPSAVMTLFWWVATPPSFRFAWGPVFTLVTVPLGWMIWRVVMAKPAAARVIRASWFAWLAVVPVLAVVAFSLVNRLDWDSMRSEREWSAVVSIPYTVVTAPVPVTNEVILDSGYVVHVASDGSSCWAAPIPCTSEFDSRLRILDPSRGFAGGFYLDGEN